MLEYCAVGVAMGNASDDVKNMADLITDEVGNDGLAHAFRRLSLI
jgi:hydroxymethylpyrimidine pyrophosphatase-like HAD family hydrolase